jgi:hypothetical protein
MFRIVKPVVKPSASLLPTAVATSFTSVTSSVAERPAAADATLTGEPPVSGVMTLIDPGLSCEVDSQCSTVRNSPLVTRSPFAG